MSRAYEVDFSEANADLAELIRLSASRRFDLFSYLRLLSEAGAPTFCADVNDVAAITTGCRVVHYKLSEGLKVILTALRAWHFDSDKVKRATSVKGSRAAAAPSSRRRHAGTLR